MEYLDILDKDGDGQIDLYQPLPETVDGQPLNLGNSFDTNLIIDDLGFLYDTKSDIVAYQEIATTDNALLRLDYMNYQLTGIKTFCGLFSLSMFGVLAVKLARRLIGGGM